jgi:hypothetical protein
VREDFGEIIMNEEGLDENLSITGKIRKAWNDDPAMVILAASSVIFATAKFVDASSMAKSRRINNKQAKYYLKLSKKQPPIPMLP